jgi:xylulokinase
MDERATKQFDRFNAGIVKTGGLNARKNLLSIRETGVTAASTKDPVYKYAWVRENEPEIFAKTYKYLDVGSYLIMRCTGRYVVTQDVAFASLLYDPKRNRWGERVCEYHNIEKSHLPEIIKSTDLVGTLTPEAAAELSLTENCKVFGGGGDVSMIAVGAGCTHLGDTLVYIGTSGWVTIACDKLKIDLPNSIASIVGAEPGYYNFFAEMELAGKCIEWARDNLMLDLVGLYDEKSVEEGAVMAKLSEIAATSPPGANGVIFAPYLLGNRCPFENPYARASFFNLSLENTKADMMRAVLEGIAYHMYWMLELSEKTMRTNETIRFVGGGARSDLLCRIFADLSGRPVEQTSRPQNAGVLGAGILTATCLGVISSLKYASKLAEVDKRYEPDPTARKFYARNYEVYKTFHLANRKSYQLLNKSE